MNVLVDGKPAETLRGLPCERALLFGDAVFESFRIEHGGVLALRRRLERLAASARASALDVDLATVRREVARAHRTFGGGPAYARVTLVRAEGRGLAPGVRECTRIVHVGPLPPASASLVAVSAQRANPSLVRAAKVASYADAAAHLRASGADEVVGVDAAGDVLEATVANVFAARAGELVTPSLAFPILPGITRALVLEEARSRGLVTHERAVPISELYRADEVFVTSSVRGVVPLASLDGVVYGAASALARSLGASLAALARAGAEPLLDASSGFDDGAATR